MQRKKFSPNRCKAKMESWEMKVKKFTPASPAGQYTTMNKLFLLLVICLAIPAFLHAQDPLAASNLPAINTNCAASQYNANVWLTNTMTKILQGSGTANPGSACTLTIYATQGEFADFQVHVLAPSGGYSALTVTSGSFVQTSPSSYTIPAPSTSQNDIVVYREAYVPVTTVTSTASVFYNVTGNYPDPLIPAIDPYWHQTTNAFPVAVTTGQNQSAWIDVLIPPAAPSGYYLGSITVSNNGTTLATMPVIIGVWQWPAAQGSSMPATPTLPTESQFGYADFCNAVYGGSSGSSCGSYQGAGGNMNNGLALSDIDGEVLMMDHRWTMTDPIQPSKTQMNAYWSGNTSGFVSAKSILQGAGVTTQNDRGQFSLPNYPTPTPQDFATYFGAFKYPYGSSGSYPKVTPVWYTADEPGSSSASWASVCNMATSAHSTNPPVATMITGDIFEMNANASTSGCTTQGVTNSVDVMVVNVVCLEPTAYMCSEGQAGGPPGIGLNLSSYSSWLSHSNPDGITPSLWSYISCSSTGTCGNGSVGNLGYANYDLDSRPIGNRVTEWMTYLHQQTGELYYAMTYAFGTGQDPWTSEYNFGNNGDGNLVYPSTWHATSTNHVTQQNGSVLTDALWIPSVRLKHMRDGGQDWEYMHALTSAGQASFVTTEIASWVTNSYTFEVTGSGLQTARLALGNALHHLTYSAVLLPPPTLTGTLQ
jgi:hypothetical protein